MWRDEKTWRQQGAYYKLEQKNGVKSKYFFFLKIFICWFMWLCWVFVSVWGPSPVAASGGHSSSRCAGLLLSRPLLFRSTGSRRSGSAVVAHGPSCSAACGILPDQGSNPCPLHWQADSQPLRHQGSPLHIFLLSASYSMKTCITNALFSVVSPVPRLWLENNCC